MKILKIREGKLKLSLNPIEARTYGLGRGQVISNKDLCATVRHLIQNEIAQDGWERLLVEGYAKMDGSYDIFVTGELTMEKAQEERTLQYFGFERREHLAFALYVLSKNTGKSPPLDMPEEECTREGGQARGNVCTPTVHTGREESLPEEVCDLFFSSERKNENKVDAYLRRRLPPFRRFIIDGERSDSRGIRYILEIEDTVQASAKATMLREFGKPLTGLTDEILTEHSSPMDTDALFADR